MFPKYQSSVTTGILMAIDTVRVKELNKVSRVSMTPLREPLRTVPTIVTAHTFCASRDTRVSYGWWLLIQEYFCAV